MPAVWQLWIRLRPDMPSIRTSVIMISGRSFLAIAQASSPSGLVNFFKFVAAFFQPGHNGFPDQGFVVCNQ